MGVGVLLRHTAVRGPPRMGDPGLSGHLSQMLPAIHVSKLAGVFANVERGVCQYRHTSRIVTSILKPLHTGVELLTDIPFRNNPGNPTHRYDTFAWRFVLNGLFSR